MFSWFSSRRTESPQIPLSPMFQQTPEEKLAAAYFGESANLFFGPHFITSPTQSRNPASPSLAANNILFNPFSFLSPPVSAPAQPPTTAQTTQKTLNLGNKITAEELADIARIYRQTPLGETNQTQTVQSHTHLRKATLKLTPLPLPPPTTSPTRNNPTKSKHILEFTFDTSSPCLIRIHYVSKEVLALMPDGRKKLGFAPKHFPDVAEGVEVKDWPVLAKGIGPRGKTYGPFGVGIGQKFVVPEVDAFESGWFTREELVYGEVDRRGLSAAGGGGSDGARAGAGTIAGPGAGLNEGTQNVNAGNRETGDGSERVQIEPAGVEENGDNEANRTDGAEENGDDEAHEEQQRQLLLDGESVYYPLVIVLEALGENSDVGDELQELHETSTNIQVTYASLVESKDRASYNVKVLKQKVMIDGTPYLLQDIFGYTDPTGTGASNPNLNLPAEELQTMRECVVCMSELKDTIVLPCRHLCLCHTCGETLRMQGRNASGGALGSGSAPKCPICRQKFDSLLQISLPVAMRNRGGAESQQASMMMGDGSTSTLLPK
ncbi:hypothetical protein HDU79_010943 [Rhizoclosmatium sp. JEL0117]|nr:hypothetical protein HDU79_010943 [Rhizoclosmatium sp. JEL0117]